MNKNNEDDQRIRDEQNSGRDHPINHEEDTEDDDLNQSENDFEQEEYSQDEETMNLHSSHEEASDEPNHELSKEYDKTTYGGQGPKKRRLWPIHLLLGVIIGILLMTMGLPAMIDSGLIPSSMIHTNDSESTPTDNNVPQESNQTNYVSVDVTSQITDVVTEVSPSVVGVTNIQRQADFWSQQSDDEAGTGSGVIYKQSDDHAYVVTNHHVVEQADLIEVVLSDETTIEAELLGSDIFTDLAVLRIDNSDVSKVIERGSSDEVKVGEPAIAIGNPLGHMFSGTVTQGVISGTQRTIPLDLNQDGRPDWQTEVIQTDAAINPGNSGGALINIDGKLIGINSMKINQTAVEGIGFAIPIDSAWPVIEELEETGEVSRPYMGVEMYSLEEVPNTEWTRTLDLPDEVKGGVYVWSVEPLSPAEHAGLERLDVITELDGQEILGTIDLRKILYQEKEIGDELRVTYYRDGEKNESTLTLGVQE